MKTDKVTINKEQRLFVIPCGNGYTCLGFEVLNDRLQKLAKEVGYIPVSKRKGTMKMYNEYNRLLDFCRKKNASTGWKSKSELIPEFIGHEGKRVEVVTSWGETQRFYIGRSMGFIPCHLQVSKRNSTGGMAVVGHPFQSIKFLGISR